MAQKVHPKLVEKIHQLVSEGFKVLSEMKRALARDRSFNMLSMSKNYYGPYLIVTVKLKDLLLLNFTHSTRKCKNFL